MNKITRGIVDITFGIINLLSESFIVLAIFIIIGLFFIYKMLKNNSKIGFISISPLILSLIFFILIYILNDPYLMFGLFIITFGIGILFLIGGIILSFFKKTKKGITLL